MGQAEIVAEFMPGSDSVTRAYGGIPYLLELDSTRSAMAAHSRSYFAELLHAKSNFVVVGLFLGVSLQAFLINGEPMISSVAVNNLNASLQQFAEAAAKISDPTRSADLEDIIQLNQAQANSEVSAAVLAKINDTQRLVDILA